MKKEFYHQIKRIIDDLNLNKEAHFVFSKNNQVITNPTHLKGYTDKDKIEDLTNFIYEHYYCKGESDPQILPYSNQTDQRAYYQLHHSFLNQLKTANQTQEGISDGWRISETDHSGRLYVTKGSDVRRTYAGEYLRTAFLGNEVTKGEVVKLAVQKEFYDPKNAFYHVFGENLGEGGRQLIRIYFHLKAEGAPVLVENLTTTFNQCMIPFQFKCLNHPHMYSRTDSAVLYLNKRYCNYAMEIMEKFHPEIAPYLKPGVPLFSKEVKKGIGFAENPPNGDSFGMSRSRIISQALVNAVNAKVNKKDLMIRVEKYFKDLNFLMDQIYLNPFSNFTYNFIK